MGLGLCSITSFSTASMPRGMAGRESVTRLIHSSCMESRGVLCHSSMAANTVMTSPMLVPSRKPTTFLMLA